MFQKRECTDIVRKCEAGRSEIDVSRKAEDSGSDDISSKYDWRSRYFDYLQKLLTSCAAADN
jgi:hypothetical protein